MKSINKSCFVAILYALVVDFWFVMLFVKPVISVSGIIGNLFFILCFFPSQSNFLKEKARSSLVSGVLAAFISNMAFNVSLFPAIICSIVMVFPIFFMIWDLYINID